MWCLWILMVIFISSSSSRHIKDARTENTVGIKYKGFIQQCTFHTKINGDGKYEITSLSGSIVDEKRRVSKFDEEFSSRAFKIAIRAEENIVIDMDVEEICFKDFSFQLPCLCYDDIFSPNHPRYQSFGANIIEYCGDKQSMICYDYTRGGPVISSNPTVLKSGAEFFEKNKDFYYNVTQVGNKPPTKFTFTINKDTPDNVEVSSSDNNVNKGVLKILEFNETEGYYDHDLNKYKIISVLPFQIFDPNCQVTWTFNGKPIEYLHKNIEFYATYDKREYFVADKRTKFTKPEKTESTTETSAAAALPFTNTMLTVSSIVFFFYTLCIYF